MEIILFTNVIQVIVSVFLHDLTQFKQYNYIKLNTV